MGKISESGYLFIHSGPLEKDQVVKSIEGAISYLSENYDPSFKKTQIEVNVVKNKEGKKFGHTYAWVDCSRVFNALIGKNFNGSQRFEEVLDEDWEEPEEDYSAALEKVAGDWGDEAEVEEMYNRPMKRVPLEPLVTLPGIKFTEEQEKEVKYESKIGFLEIFETKISEKIGKINTLYSGNIPEWVSEKMILDYFKKFEKDKVVYMEKKSRNKFSYPIVKIKSKKEVREVRRSCTIIFSTMYKNTASFLINMTKRVEFEKDGKKTLLFFSQSKSKNY
jgi:hypothetical protein